MDQLWWDRGLVIIRHLIKSRVRVHDTCVVHPYLFTVSLGQTDIQRVAES